jgi:NADH-quinone oxidoreductase subunit H
VPFVLDQDQIGWFPSLVKVLVMLIKVSVMILIIMWVRWTLPRFRYDTLMDLAWKRMIPLGLVNLVVTASILQFLYG